MTFQPGQSGNPGGRKKTKPFSDALLKAVMEMAGDKFELSPQARRIDRLAQELVKEGLEGTNRVAAIKEIRDTLEGKPTQTIAGDGDNPLAVNFTLTFGTDASAPLSKAQALPEAE